MSSEELGGSTAQNQGEVNQDGEGKTDSRSTSHQDDSRVFNPIRPGNRTERSFDECTEENAAIRGISSLRRFFAITVVFVPDGESDDVVPKGLGPPSLCTDEEDEDTTGGVGRLLVANRADGERMGGELVDRRNGEDEMLSWSPWSTFWGENGEADRFSGHEFGESVSGRRYVSIRWRHQGFYPGWHARVPSQEWGVVIFLIFRHRVQTAHFETETGEG